MSSRSEQIRSLASMTSKEDLDLITVFRTTADSPVNIIPDDADAQTLFNYLRVSTQALTSATDLISRLKPFIGRIILLIKKNPGVVKEWGFDNYDDFMTRGLSISRAEAYGCVSIAEHLGFLPSTVLQELRVSKLFPLAQAIKRTTMDGEPLEMVERKRNEWVQLAQNNTAKAFKAEVARRLTIEPGELEENTHVVIPCKVETKERWESLVGSESTHERCGTQDKGQIFDYVIAETATEWAAQDGDAIRAAANGEAQAG